VFTVCVPLERRPAEYQVVSDNCASVPSAGWRIREIPDCASLQKTHKGVNRRPCLALLLLLLFFQQQASNNFPQSNPLQDP
jgi:hypothetical protein